MADTKITALAAITTVDPAADVLPIVDISDTSMAASGTTKKITSNQILGAGGTATLASASITGDLTVDTSTLKVDSTNNRVGIGTASPTTVLDVVGPGDGELRLRAASDTSLILSETTANKNWKVKPSSGDLYFQYSATAYNSGYSSLMSLTASGNLGLGVTPSAGGGVLQLKSGITFPATQVASSDANTLDDYEEGTWTPTITAETGTIGTTVVNSANYTKIGRLVSVTFDITITSAGTGSGGLKVSLPFFPAVAGNTCGSVREYLNSGDMGQVFKYDATNVLIMRYNNTTFIVNGNKLMASYTYYV